MNSLKILMFIYFLNVSIFVFYIFTQLDDFKIKNESMFLRTSLIIFVIICCNLYGMYKAYFIHKLDLKSLCRKTMKLSLKNNKNI